MYKDKLLELDMIEKKLDNMKDQNQNITLMIDYAKKNFKLNLSKGRNVWIV